MPAPPRPIQSTRFARPVPTAPVRDSWDRPTGADRLASALETCVAGVVIIVAAMGCGALLAGCDSDGLGIGDFRGTVQVDAASRPVEGEAVYTVVETPQGPRFVLGLFVGDLYDSRYNEYDFAALRRDGGRPGVGAFSVTPEGAGARAFTASYSQVTNADDPEEASGPAIRATEGVVTITSVDDYGFISGTVHFSGDGVRVENPRARIRGGVSSTFEARYETPETLRRLGVDIGLDG